ncbi:MAG TPA: hypothetical protein DCM86_01200 [Verrucomicrobiales bacterium]|nr:hypothetical protein [Verrucomicrobiales bacterium]
MQSLLAIARLTWKSAFRYRLFWVLAAVLLGAVVLLPMVVKDDGTVSGFVQILLTYTLSVTLFLLGLSTLWLACGTLARDIEECQIQMLVVKPVARWQIWLGKWLGIVTLNALLLAIAGGAVFGLLEYRTSKLPPGPQKVMREEVLVARASYKPHPPELEGEIEARFAKVPNREALPPDQQEELRKKIADRVRLDAQIVPPMGRRGWVFELGLDSRFRKEEPLFIRVKFYTASTNGNSGGLYEGSWFFSSPGSDTVTESPPIRLASDSYQEFQIKRNPADDQGRLVIFFQSREDLTLLFPLEDGIEVLRRDGSFGWSFARGLGVLLAWLALLAALGLSTASVTSFPVAAFSSISLLVVVLSSSTLSESVSNQTVMMGRPDEFTTIRPVLNALFIPLFKAILAVVGVVNVASPVDLLSTGRSVTWELLAVAWIQIVLVAGGVLAAVGIVLFTRRELATAQGGS